MKLSFKIMTAIVIFAVMGITGCTKNSMNLNEKESVFSESVSFDEVITNLNDQGLIISVDENYTDEISGATGTLYTYKSKDGVKQILKANSDFSYAEKGIKHSIKAWVYTDVNGDIIATEYTCEGSGSQCVGFTHLFIAL